MADLDDDAKDTEDEADEAADAQERFAICEEAWAENRRLALEDLRFARLEEQWPERIRRERELDGKPCLTLNQLHGFIFQVVNDARQNKPSINVHPVGDGADVHVAEIYNGLIRHIEQSSDADVAYDTAMDAAVSSGFGYFRINTRYRDERSFDQDLTIERMADHLAVYPDPHSTAADSSDWNECYVLDSMPKTAFKKRWPGKEAVSFEGGAAQTRKEVSDEEMVTVAECWTREEVRKTILSLSPINQEGAPDQVSLANRLAGDALVIGEMTYKLHKDLFDALGVTVAGKREVVSHKVTQRLVSGADVLETVEWAGKYIPIVPVWGEELYVEGKRILRSLIRGAHDGQRMFNYWHSNAVEMAALAPKTPWLGKVGAFVTDSDKWATANTQAHSFIEYDGNEAPQRPQPPPVPAAAMQLAGMAQQNIMSIVGIYKASIGASSNEDSGVAINARDRQADTGTFHFIDNLSRAIRHAGRILIDLIPKVYSTPRILRILKPDGKPDLVPVNQTTQVPQLGPDGQPMQDLMTGQLVMIEKMLDLTVGTYDLVVKAGPSFASQREEMIAKLTQLVQAEPRLAPVVADIFVKNYDIPEADEIVRRIQAMSPVTDPELEKAKQTIGKLQQALGVAHQKLAGKSADAATDQEYLEIEGYEAETKRLGVLLGKEGANPGMDALAPLVATILHQIASAPDPMAALAQMTGQGGGGPPQPPAPPMSGPGPLVEPHFAPAAPGFGQAA